jgi:DNA helicase II / ATP-dependent DNA helicase PcrA
MPWNDDLVTDTPAHKLASSSAPVIRSLAGPGSGKSFAIKRRIARLMESGVDPSKILAITFTRTSAADLRKEIASIEADGADLVVARTLHSHAMSILMKAEVQEVMKRNPRMIIDHEITPALRDINFPENSKISDRTDLLRSYEAAWATLQIEKPGFPRSEIEKEFESRLVQWLCDHQAIMIGEVVPLALRYLRDNPASPEVGKYQAILVDEYQDLNKAEQMFIKILKKDADIVIVGDDDQSIYGFKNAHPEGIKQLGEIYGDFEDISFDTIRRCPKKVTEMASELISKNTNRSLGSLQAFDKNQDGKVEIIQWKDDKEEIDGLLRIVKNELDSAIVKPEDILILSPRRLIGYKLRDKLLSSGIRVKSYFRENIIKNESVRRAYSLLYLFAFPEDKISLRFLLSCKSQNHRAKPYKIISDYANINSLSIREVLNKILEGEITINNISSLVKEYKKILIDLKNIEDKLLSDEKYLFSLFSIAADDEADFYELQSIYQSAIQNKPKPEEVSDSKLQIWFSDIVKEITESIALPDSPENIDHVRIMSLYASKGLSAKIVIVVSMIDNLMPFIPKDSDTVKTKKAIEEQRRLFYVAISRCKSSEKEYPGRLIISSFIWIDPTDASRMGIVTNRKQMAATRFINDFGTTAPQTILGEDVR